MNKNKKIIAISIFLTMLVVISLYLRLRMLNIKLFWFDEFFTEERSFFDFIQIWNYYKTQRVLLFSLMMKLYSFIIFQINKAEYMTEFQLRLPNVIVGTLNILIIYLVASRIKDQTCGLIASIICSFSYFLIFYSREARFYPLLFTASSLLLMFGVLIASKNFQPKNEFRIYIYYSIVATLGMYTHTGFWLLYAISNLFLVINDAIVDILLSKSSPFLMRIKKLIIKTSILAIPILFSVPLFLHLTKSDSQRPPSNGMQMLESFSYNIINDFSCNYWQLSPFEKYMLIIVTSMAVILFVLSFFGLSKQLEIGGKKLRTITLYLYVIKILPFAIALLLPRNIIKERLLPKYILFVFSCDIIIVSFFISTFIEICFKKVLSKSYFCFSYIFSLLFFFLISIISIPKLLKSDLYKPNHLLGDSVNKLKEIWRQGDYIITDDLELHKWLNHAVIAGIFPKGCFSSINYIENEGYIMPGISGLIIKTSGNVINVPNLIYLGNSGLGNAQTGSKGIGKFYYVELDGFVDKKLIMGITSRIIKNTPTYGYAKPNERLSSWRNKIKDDRIEHILENGGVFESMIINGDFKNGLTNWVCNNYFSLKQEKDYYYLYLKPSSESRWRNMKQTFNSVSGDVYCISADIRRSSSRSDGKTFIVFANLNKKNQYFNENYFLISNKTSSHSWINVENTVESKYTGKSLIRIQYRGDGIVDIKNIKVVKRRTRAD